jgi:hypothetical protein
VEKLTKEQIIERYWQYRKGAFRDNRGFINFTVARDIEFDFQKVKGDEWAKAEIKFFCPFCKKEIDSSHECEHCGAKVIYYDGGCYCPLCESSHYMTNNKEDLEKLKEVGDD